MTLGKIGKAKQFPERNGATPARPGLQVDLGREESEGLHAEFVGVEFGGGHLLVDLLLQQRLEVLPRLEEHFRGEFVAHVCEGADSSIEIAELMGKPRGTISKWVRRAERDGRITRKGNRLLPPEDDPFEDGDEE